MTTHLINGHLHSQDPLHVPASSLRPPASGTSTAVHGEPVVDRVARVLRAFDSHDASLSVSQIAERAALPLPSASRLITQLVNTGLLERLPSRQIRVSIGLWQIGQRNAEATQLRRAAAAHLWHLLHQTDADRVQLWLISGDAIVLIDEQSTDKRADGMSHIGDTEPMDSGPAGTVVHAFSARRGDPPSSADPYARYSPTPPASLEIRRRGFAQRGPSPSDPTIELAVPLRDQSGNARAAISARFSSLPQTCNALGALRTVAAQIELWMSDAV